VPVPIFITFGVRKAIMTTATNFLPLAGCPSLLPP
jgi:hypothetical protein